MIRESPESILRGVDLVAIGLVAWTVAANPANAGVYIAVLATIIFFWAVIRRIMRETAHAEIAERAELQHEQWMNGDDRGLYGD